MPLKIRVKPEGKIFAGGAVLKNVGSRPAELLILSDSPVLRDDYLMNIERRDESDATNIYFLLQVVYLFKGKGQPMDALVVSTLKSFADLYPALANDVADIVSHLEAGEAFKALRVAHKLLAEQQKPANQAEAEPLPAPPLLPAEADAATAS